MVGLESLLGGVFGRVLDISYTPSQMDDHRHLRGATKQRFCIQYEGDEE